MIVHNKHNVRRKGRYCCTVVIAARSLLERRTAGVVSDTAGQDAATA